MHRAQESPHTSALLPLFSAQAADANDAMQATHLRVVLLSSPSVTAPAIIRPGRAPASFARSVLLAAEAPRGAHGDSGRLAAGDASPAVRRPSWARRLAGALLPRRLQSTSTSWGDYWYPPTTTGGAGGAAAVTMIVSAPPLGSADMLVGRVTGGLPAPMSAYRVYVWTMRCVAAAAAARAGGVPSGTGWVTGADTHLRLLPDAFSTPLPPHPFALSFEKPDVLRAVGPQGGRGGRRGRRLPGGGVGHRSVRHVRCTAAGGGSVPVGLHAACRRWPAIHAAGRDDQRAGAGDGSARRRGDGNRRRRRRWERTRGALVHAAPARRAAAAAAAATTAGGVPVAPCPAPAARGATAAGNLWPAVRGPRGRGGCASCWLVAALARQPVPIDHPIHPSVRLRPCPSPPAGFRSTCLRLERPGSFAAS